VSRQKKHGGYAVKSEEWLKGEDNLKLAFFKLAVRCENVHTMQILAKIVSTACTK
jgi:hypothetical protein